MKGRKFVAVGFVALAALAVCDRRGRRVRRHQAARVIVTVWLQVDAQSGWPDLVAAANSAVPEGTSRARRRRPVPAVARPPAQVRRDARRRERARRHRDGQHRDDEVHGGRRVPGSHRRKSSFDEREHLARGPRASGRYNGKTVRRPVLRRARASSRTAPTSARRPALKVPTTLAQFTVDAKKLARQERQEGLLARLHRRAGLVRRDGLRLRLRRADRDAGQAASGSARSTSPKSLAGLTAFKTFFHAASKASKTHDRDPAEPVRRVRPGHGRVDRRPDLVQLLRRQEVHGRDRAVRDAEPHGRARSMPGFLGGSDLAVPVGADKDLAADWIKAFTSTHREKGLQAKGNIPNTTTCSGNEDQRAGCLAQLVRPDREELGQRREREHPPQHAVADPDRQADRSSRPPRSASDNIEIGSERLE